MALIMARAFRGKGFVRAAILIPWAIPTVVSARMWGLIFDSNGVMNAILGQKILWLADNSYSQMAIVIADVWKTAPFIGLLTLAGPGLRGQVRGVVRCPQPAPQDAAPHARHDAHVRPAVGHGGPGQVLRGNHVDPCLRREQPAALRLCSCLLVGALRLHRGRCVPVREAAGGRRDHAARQRKRQKELAKASNQKVKLARSTITSGEGQS